MTVCPTRRWASSRVNCSIGMLPPSWSTALTSHHPRQDYLTLMAEPALPFRILDLFQDGADRGEFGVGLLPQGVLVLEGLVLLRRGPGVSSALTRLLRTRSGGTRVMQGVDFLRALLKEGIYECNAVMEFHTCAP